MAKGRPDNLYNGCRLTIDDVKPSIVHALTLLFRKDRTLLRINVNEETISHRLAMYLDACFPGADVDCEYNRRGHDQIKVLQFLDKVNPTSVYPDIIVHIRTDPVNVLVIEVKKTQNDDHAARAHDLEKLQLFTINKPRFHLFNFDYHVGIFLDIPTGSDVPARRRLQARCTWFVGGTLCAEEWLPV